MTRTLNRLIAFSFAVIATVALQGTMLAGFDNLAQAGQLESQAQPGVSACSSM